MKKLFWTIIFLFIFCLASWFCPRIAYAGNDIKTINIYAERSDTSFSNYKVGNFVTWNKIRNDAYGYRVNDNFEYVHMRIRGKGGAINSNRFMDLQRIGLSFDTSILGDNVQLESVKLYIFGASTTIDKLGMSSVDREVSLVDFYPSSSVKYTIYDYNKFGTEKLADNIDPGENFSLWKYNEYNVFDMYQSVFNRIDKTGFTNLGLRFECDRVNHEPSFENTQDQNALLYMYFRDSRNQNFWPYLEVSYSVPDDNEELNPVVVVPGIGGSWEKDREWVIDPILHTYDYLLEAFEAAGYVPGETLFTMPYDWRNDNRYSAIQLREAIEAAKGDAGGKVDIVAHSMGGLVARSYIESDNYRDDVDQLIFLDTPQAGAPESYLAYEGAYLPGMIGAIKKFYFEVEGKLHGYDSLPEYFREKVIGLGQLLPDYSYLYDNTGNEWQLRAYPDNYPRNVFLEDLNLAGNIDKLLMRSNTYNIYSYAGVIDTDDTTMTGFRVELPKKNDPDWLHGYPVNLSSAKDGVMMGAGDGTVPLESLVALPMADSKIVASAGHREIVTQAQQEVIEALTGERPDDFVSGPLARIKRLLFVRVYSPVDLLVTTPAGERLGYDAATGADIFEPFGSFYSGHSAAAEFATWPVPAEGTYQVALTGTADGYYRLGFDVLTDAAEEAAEPAIYGIIRNGESKNYAYTLTPDSAGQTEINLNTEISPNDFARDIEAINGLGGFSRKAVYNYLRAQAKIIGKEWDKLDSGSKRARPLLSLIAKGHLLVLEKLLDFYLNKQWITPEGHGVLHGDIGWLRITLAGK